MNINIIDNIKTELNYYGKFEKTFYLLVIISICIISVMLNDSKIALISSICGITYTLFAGKGKVYCYYIGLIGTFCYCLIAYKNGFYGNMALYGLYFFPMQIIGIFQWKKNLNKEKNEIYKSKLSFRQRVIYLIITLVLTIIIFGVIKYFKGHSPYIDAFITGFSVLGQFLTVKRCIEQWYIWFLVNLLSVIMWTFACYNGANYYATLMMWIIYLILSVYFLKKWGKEI